MPNIITNQRIVRVAAGAGVAFSALDPANKDPNITLSGGNLVATLSTGTFDSGGVRGTLAKSTGKWYAELTLAAWTNGASRGSFGVGTSAASINDTYLWGIGDSISASYGDGGGGVILADAGNTNIPATNLAQGQVIGLAVDVPNHRIYWSNNGAWQNGANPAAGTGYVDYITTGPIYLLVGLWHFASGGTAEKAILNTGRSTFAYGPPSGFLPWG